MLAVRALLRRVWSKQLMNYLGEIESALMAAGQTHIVPRDKLKQRVPVLKRVLNCTFTVRADQRFSLLKALLPSVPVRFSRQPFSISFATKTREITRPTASTTFGNTALPNWRYA